MVLLAFSLQDQVEKYGAYVGIASFFGLAVLSLLYFAQAREVKRLREWAGRAPERAAEVEAMAVAHAEEALRAPEPAPAAAPVAAPEPAVAASNGAAKPTPAEVAALAFARAAGVHTPHVPRPHAAPLTAATATATPAEEVAAAGAAAAAGEPAAAQAVAPPAADSGNGTGEMAAPPPATPAARRAEPPQPPARLTPAPARRQPPPRRPAAQPARRESSTRAVVLTAVIGVLVLGGVAFGLTRVLGGGGDATPKGAPPIGTATPEASAAPSATAAPALTKDAVRVAVYNGTVQPGLAGSIRDQLVNQGYKPDNVGADTYTPNQQRPTSVVMYQRGAKPAAQGVATSLGIRAVQLIDAATQSLVQQSGKQRDVVVIVGADKSQ